jgi:hypothetical protein
VFYSTGGSGKPDRVAVVVNRASGAVVRLDGHRGADRFLALSSPDVERPLCATVRRTLTPSTSPNRYWPLTKVGPWTLRAEGETQRHTRRRSSHRCDIDAGLTG